MDHAIGIGIGILIGIILSLSFDASSQDSWNCYSVGNQRICSGFQNGRFVTCTTTFFGNQSTTTCT